MPALLVHTNAWKLATLPNMMAEFPRPEYGPPPGIWKCFSAGSGRPPVLMTRSTKRRKILLLDLQEVRCRSLRPADCAALYGALADVSVDAT
jgi:hypothetical protein